MVLGGSGGMHGAYSTLRRCGVGLAHMVGNVYMGGLHFKLPGDVQTVPRSEVSPCHALVAHLDFNTNVEFYSDSQLFVEAFNNGIAYCSSTLNSDLFNEIFEMIVDKNIKIEVFWIPSHMYEDPLKERNTPPPKWFDDAHALGNHHADRLAGVSASYYALHNDIAAPIIRNVLLDVTFNAGYIPLYVTYQIAKLIGKPKRPSLALPHCQNQLQIQNTPLMTSNKKSLSVKFAEVPAQNPDEKSEILCWDHANQTL